MAADDRLKRHIGAALAAVSRLEIHLDPKFLPSKEKE